MRILEIAEFLESRIGSKVYPIQFPQAKDEAIMVRILSSDGQGEGVSNITIEVMSRAKHPAKSEELIHKVNEPLQLISDIDFKNYQVILVRALSEPEFDGESTSGYFFFRNDYQLLVSRLEE